MKKRHIINLLLCVSMAFCFFTVPVSAIQAETKYININSSPSFSGFGYTYTGGIIYVWLKSNAPSKAFFVFKDSDFSRGSVVVISETSGNVATYYQSTSPSSLSGGNYVNNVNNYNSTNNVYYTIFNNTRHPFTNVNGSSSYLINENLLNMSGDALVNFCMENVTVPTDWGNPRGVNLSTTYAGNVERSQANIDKITWNTDSDTKGNSYITHIDEHPVIEVQAVPVTWKTSTLQEMENQTGADATVGNGVALDSYNARTGHLEITWQEVIDYLQIEYANIYSAIFDGEYWVQKGWYYQYRLVADNYVGEWNTLYNGLNLSPTKSKRIVENPYDESIYNILKEISESNSQTTTVYEYGDNNYITINNDPSSGWQDPDGGGSFWDFLASVVKAISDGIASIVSSVTSLVGDLVNGILGLFTFDTFEINNYNTEVQTLKDNSGIFGQSIEFADSIKDSIRGVEQQPAILHFDGIVIDNVQLIPAVDLDFDQMVIDAGLTDFHNLVYVFTDGMILISLIIMVHRKVMEVLRK